jgi:hypothetical protein
MGVCRTIDPARQARGGNKRHVEVREVMNGIMYIKARPGVKKPVKVTHHQLDYRVSARLAEPNFRHIQLQIHTLTTLRRAAISFHRFGPLLYQYRDKAAEGTRQTPEPA